MKVTVGQIVSTPPTAQSLSVQVVRDALRIVAARLQAAGLGDRELKLDALDLAMPAPASHLGTPLERSRASRVLAGRIIAQVGPGLGLAPDAALIAGSPARGDLVHAKALSTIRRAIQGISYAPAVKVVSSSKTPPAPRTSYTPLQKIRSYFGLMKVKTTDAPALEGQTKGDDKDFITDFLAVEARLRAGQPPSKADWTRLRAGVSKHFRRHGVAVQESGNEFMITRSRGGSQLNVLAWTAYEKLGISMSYDLGRRLVPNASVGSFNSTDNHLNLDNQSMLACSPSGTALHELHHASLYKRIAKGKDSFLNLKMWSTDGEALGFYKDMSSQELSTFAKQPRQVLGQHLRGGDTYTPALDEGLRSYMWKMHMVALQARQATDAMIPELESFVHSGSSKVIKFGRDTSGDNQLRFVSEKLGLHHRVVVHTHGTKEARKANPDKPAGQKALALDLLEKLRLTHSVSELMLLQSHVILGELRQLNGGQDLTKDEIKALQDLMTWAGYGVRVADDPRRTAEEKRVELLRQQELAESRLGIQRGTVLKLPEFTQEYVYSSAMAIRPAGNTLPVPHAPATPEALELSSRLKQIAADADEKSKSTRWFTRALDWMFPKTHGLALTEKERLAASAVGGQMRDQVIAKHLKADRGGGQISIAKVGELSQAFLEYAARNGITLHHKTGMAPAVIPDAADFTSMTQVDTEKESTNFFKKQWANYLKNNTRHEVVHTMHMTQVRVTVMKQVCEKHRVSAVGELGPDALREIQERIQRFESGSNYHQYEVLACRTGGPGGRLNRDESEFRASLMQGTHEVEDALKRDDQKLTVSNWTRDPNDVTVWQRVIRALRDYFGNVIGAGGSATGQFGRLGDGQIKMASNLVAPVVVASAVAGTVGLPVAICLPIVYWFLLQHGTRAGMRELVEKLGPKPPAPGA
jgi:hypothetical protein